MSVIYKGQMRYVRKRGREAEQERDSSERTFKTTECYTNIFVSFNLHSEYLIRNASLDESQAGIKIARWNINNLRHVDDTTLMAKSEKN